MPAILNTIYGSNEYAAHVYDPADGSLRVVGIPYDDAAPAERLSLDRSALLEALGGAPGRDSPALLTLHHFSRTQAPDSSTCDFLAGFVLDSSSGHLVAYDFGDAKGAFRGRILLARIKEFEDHFAGTWASEYVPPGVKESWIRKGLGEKR